LLRKRYHMKKVAAISQNVFAALVIALFVLNLIVPGFIQNMLELVGWFVVWFVGAAALSVLVTGTVDWFIQNNLEIVLTSQILGRRAVRWLELKLAQIVGYVLDVAEQAAQRVSGAWAELQAQVQAGVMSKSPVLNIKM
jgi:hypothetical protein